ncbi:hypothetical protein HMPREF1631_00580 [Arcanobacterium sp. S3PF19]|nr:hypothetical protein HMPREF1631_00580 [Arcanobacterium sp. S3PF19]
MFSFLPDLSGFASPVSFPLCAHGRKSSVRTGGQVFAQARGKACGQAWGSGVGHDGGLDISQAKWI